jgi:hypothetical protein
MALSTEPLNVVETEIRMPEHPPLRTGAYDFLLGVLDDGTVSRLARCTKQAVWWRRRRLWLARTENRHGSAWGILPHGDNNALALRIGISPEDVEAQVNWQPPWWKVGHRLDPMQDSDLLGVDPRQVAERFRLDVLAVKHYIGHRFGAGATLRWVSDTELREGTTLEVAARLGVSGTTVHKERLRRFGYTRKRRKEE